MDLEDDAVLVTGATGGIGQAVCDRLARAGARIGVHFRSKPDEATRLVAELEGTGHAAIGEDLEAGGAPGRLIEDAVESLGGLDVLVNNAGVYTEHPPLETGPDAWREHWDRTLRVNLQAPADLCYHAARHMADNGGGRIVNVSSRGAFRGEPTAPAYGAAKAGLNSLTGSLAQALAPHGVTVTAVAPGFVATPMVEDLLEGASGDEIRAQSPTGRVAQPEEIAEAVAFLASGDCPYATGAILDVNGASYLRT